MEKQGPHSIDPSFESFISKNFTFICETIGIMA